MVTLTLRAARVNTGMTRKEAAKYFGCHYETLSNYESNSSGVPHKFFSKIPLVYGVPSDCIYFGKEEDFFKEKQKVLQAV
jgi:transcriptional regulator with XRE-family HTH domain